MIVPSRWIREWLLFAYYKTANEPGPITMSTLLTADGNNWWRPLKTLRPPSTEPGKEHPGHYRCEMMMIMMMVIMIMMIMTMIMIMMMIG